MLSMTFTGLVAYPITPFQQGGRLDLESFGRYVGRLSRSGVDALVVLGSSGSFAYLSGEERAEVVGVAVEAARGSGVPVGAGISAMTTREVLEMAYAAENSGGAGGIPFRPVFNNAETSAYVIRCLSPTSDGTMPTPCRFGP